MDLSKLLHSEKKQVSDEGDKSNTPDKSSSTKPNSNLSSEQKNSNKRINFLHKYMIIKEPKQSSNSDTKTSVITKIRNSLNSNKDLEKMGYKEIQKEQKSLRNIKKSMFESNFHNSTDRENKKEKSELLVPQNLKFTENRNALAGDQVNRIFSSFNPQKETIKSNINKKLDLSSIANLSTNNTNNSNVILNRDLSFNGISLMKKYVTKNPSSFKHVHEDSTKFLLHNVIPKISKK